PQGEKDLVGRCWDHRGGYSTPLVEGAWPWVLGSSSTAVRSARASALKPLSAMWCELAPYRHSRCTQAPAFMAKAWWNSLKSSVSMSPTLGVRNSTFQIR